MIDIDAKKSALVLLDLQKGLIGGPFAPNTADQVLARSKAVAEAFRAAGGKVIMVNVGWHKDFGDALKQEVDQPMHGEPPGDDWFDFVGGIHDPDNDIVITKRQWGAFYGTELELQLERRGIDTVVLAGYATNIAVESTAREAWERGFRVLFVGDAIASFSPEMHQHAMLNTFPLIGSVRRSSEIIATLKGEYDTSYTCFVGRTALVTGAGSGIGEAIARELASHGANLAVVDVNLGNAESTVADIRASGGKAIAIKADVSDPEANKAMVEKTLAEFGALHYAVNNAGVNGEFEPSHARDPEHWRRTVDINLDGVNYGMRYELPAILAAGGGAIVNISSVFSRKALPFNAPYTASKAGVSGLSRSVGLEYAKRGVRINAVSPGPVWTPLAEQFREGMLQAEAGLPTKKAAVPQEIADVAAFVLSDQASLLVGTEVMADSGKSIL